jgi:hypothetical protein
MSRITERRFKQEYAFKGVTKGPDRYADEIIAGLQRSYVAAAVSAPWVRIAQFGPIVERGKGTEWRIDYTQRDYSLNVLSDVQTGGGPKWQKLPLGGRVQIGIEPRVRVVRFVIDVIVIETLSKDTVSLTEGMDSDKGPDTAEIDKVFTEIVKQIMVTTEASAIAGEATSK